MFWLILLSGVVIISAVSVFLLRQVPANHAHIYHDGELTETVNIAAVTDPVTITLRNSTGTNVIFIEHGRLRMQTADCPDQTCVRQGWLSDGIFPIVCLPNRVVITLEGDSNGSGVDAVVG